MVAHFQKRSTLLLLGVAFVILSGLKTNDYLCVQTQPLNKNWEQSSASEPMPKALSYTMNAVHMKGCKNRTVSVPLDTSIPIFVLTRDRVNSLHESLTSYKRTIQSRYEIIILDHNSTYPGMLSYLDKLKADNVTVHALPNVDWHKVLQLSQAIIKQYLEAHPKVKYYVFTDPDIAIPQAKPDILLYMAGYLEACPRLNVVRPALPIADVPDTANGTVNGKTQLVSEWHSRNWKNVPLMAVWNNIGYHFTELAIDTTFAMRRRSLPFNRKQTPAIRIYAPYAARHVDWYDDGTGEDKSWYKKRVAGAISHW